MNQAQRIIVSVALVTVLIGFWGSLEAVLDGDISPLQLYFEWNVFVDGIPYFAISAAIPLFFIWKTKEVDE